MERTRVSERVGRKLESLLTHIFHIGINSFYRGIFRKPAAKRWAVSSRKKSYTLTKNSILLYREKNKNSARSKILSEKKARVVLLPCRYLQAEEKKNE